MTLVLECSGLREYPWWVVASNPNFSILGLVSLGIIYCLFLTFPPSAPRLRRSAPASHAPPEPRGGGESLEIKGLDGSTFEFQVGDDATVEDVYKYISEKIGLKPGRKLLMISGCMMMNCSRPLLEQVEGREISFIVQRITLIDFAKSFLERHQTPDQRKSDC